ncbi:MAG: DUF3558 family protein [Thermocrispum sp.]
MATGEEIYRWFIEGQIGPLPNEKGMQHWEDGSDDQASMGAGPLIDENRPSAPTAVSARGVATSLASLAMLVAAAGCSDEVHGSPQSPNQASGSGQAPAPADELAVRNPLNVEPFLRRPCDLVDKQTVDQIGDLNPTPEVDTQRAKKFTGPLCEWLDEYALAQVAVVISVPHSEAAAEQYKGIRGVYAGNVDDPAARFEAVEIPGHPGYPAVINQTDRDVSKGYCPIYVGVTDALTIIVSARNEEDPPKACDGTVAVTASVLATLKKWA